MELCDKFHKHSPPPKPSKELTATKSLLGRGFPGGTVIKNLPANAGDVGCIPRLGISPGEGNGNPFQYSCLGNPRDREAWWATVHSITKSQT